MSLKKIFWVLLIAVISFGLSSLFWEIKKQPENFRVQQSISIKAPLEIVYNLLSNEENFSQWGPWEGSSNKTRLSVINRDPMKKLDLVLEFSEPAPYKTNGDFILIPSNGETVVVWGIYGKNASWSEKIAFRIKNPTIQMDKDLELGLKRIKVTAEAIPVPEPTPPKVKLKKMAKKVSSSFNQKPKSRVKKRSQ